MLLPSVTELRRHMFLSPEGWGTHSHITKLTMLDNTSKNIFARCRNKFNDEHKFLSLCNSRILWFAKRISVNILIFPFLFKWIKTAYRITSKNYRSIHIVLQNTWNHHTDPSRGWRVPLHLPLACACRSKRILWRSKVRNSTTPWQRKKKSTMFQ